MDKIAFTESLVGERIVLKKINPDLAGKIFTHVDRDRERLSEFLPWVDDTKGVEDSIDFIKMSLEKWENGNGFVYSINTLSDMKFLGLIDLHLVSWNHSFGEIGYWVTCEAQGSGYMSEAVNVFTEYLFESGFNRVEIRCDVLNERSKSIPLRCGYRHEGTLRQSAFTGKRFRDTEIYGKLKSDK